MLNSLPICEATNHNYLLKSLKMSTFESAVDSASTPSANPLPYLEQRRPLKTALLALAARTKRGEIASKLLKSKALQLIEKLETFNPIESPSLSNYSIGRWELIYSNTNLFRSSPFFMAARAVCKDGDEANSFNLFCDLHRDALALQILEKYPR